MNILALSRVATITLGPFVDKDDALTPLTALAGSMVVQLSRNGSTFATRNSATAITHAGSGYYKVTLDATDTSVYCSLTVMVNNPSVHLPVWKDYQVLSQDKFDALQGAGWDVNVTGVAGSSVAGVADFKADVSGLSTFDASSDNVTVAAVTTAVLAQFFEDDAGAVAGSGSVVEGSQGTASAATVQAGLDANGYTPTRAAKLDNLDAAVSSVSGGAGGPGAVQKTIRTTVAGVPEDNVAVWLTTDAAGNNWYAGTSYSNAAGEVTFMVDLYVEYFVWREKGGKRFTNPQSKTWTS